MFSYDAFEALGVVLIDIHRVLHMYMVVERSSRRAVEVQANSEEETKKVCSILEEYGYECNLEC